MASMNTPTFPQTFSEQIVRTMGMWKPVQQVIFPTGEITTPLTNIEIRPLGELLRVPPFICAVMVQPDGAARIYSQGSHYLRFPFGGIFTIQYVNMQAQQTYLPAVLGVTLDAWDVSLAVNIHWQVTRPEKVIGLTGFNNLLNSALQAVIVDYIRSVVHDELIPAPGGQALEAKQIGEALLRELNAGAGLRGVHFLAVLVLECRGDHRRTEVIHQATIEKATLQEQNSVEMQRLQLASERVAQTKRFLEGQQELELKRTEIDRLKLEEEEKVRLRKAQIDAEVAKQLRDAQLQEIEMQRQAELQRMQHEQVLKSMEVRAQAIGQLAGAILQTQAGSGMLRPLDENGRESLVHALESLAELPTLLPSQPALDAGEPPALTLRDRLCHEIGRIYSLPGARCEALKNTKDGSIQVVVFYMNFCITITCGTDYPVAPPQRVVVYDTQKISVGEVTVTWKAGLGLSDVVSEAVAKGLSEADQLHNRAGGNGGEETMPVAE